jgi:DNA-binding response OmpR family regulator
MLRDSLACPSTHERCPPSQRTVMVVEDDVHAAKLVSVQLQREGYGVVVAHTGEEALAQVERFLPLAIILDILLPKMDGWEVLARLKASPCACDVPVIILSVLDRQSLGFELGAVEYLVKPVERSELLHAVHCCEQRQRRAGRNARVLVVHDDPDRFATLEALLYEQGYDVMEALGEAEAVDLATRSRPDIVIIDLIVSQIAGQRLLAQTRTQGLPVLVLSASDATLLDSTSTPPVIVRALKPETTVLSVIDEMFEHLAAATQPEDTH